MTKFTADFEKIIKEQEAKMATISQVFNPLTSYVVDYEGQVIILLEKIKIIEHEKNWEIEIIHELRGLIHPKLETMMSALKEAKIAIAVSDLDNLENIEIKNYLFYGNITILENLKKGWDNSLGLLKRKYVDILKSLLVK